LDDTFECPGVKAEVVMSAQSAEHLHCDPEIASPSLTWSLRVVASRTMAPAGTTGLIAR